MDRPATQPATTPTESSWVAAELQEVDLGDARSNKRLATVLERLSQRPNVSIPAACGGWAETQGA